MIIFMIFSIGIILVGAITLNYQVYKLVTLDAESRGLKHPKFWGFFSLSRSNGSGGLLLYLIGRKKYPSNMSDDVKDILSSRKKRAGVSLCFIAVGTIGLLAISLFGNI